MKKLLLASALVLGGCGDTAPAGLILGDVIFGIDSSKPMPVENARLNYPEDAVEASDGTIYVSDTHLHVIRKIKDGIVENFAGTFESGFNGDGPRESVMLNLPTGLLISDDQKYLNFADSGNNLIRRINIESGEVSTIAGIRGGEELPNVGTAAATSPIGYTASLKYDENGNLCFPSTRMIKGISVEGGIFCIDKSQTIIPSATTSTQKFEKAKDILIGENESYVTEVNKLYRFKQNKDTEVLKMQSGYGKGLAKLGNTLFVGNHTLLYAVDESFNSKIAASGFANISNVKPYHGGLLITDSDQGVIYSFDGVNKTQLTGTSPNAIGALTSVAQYGEGKLLILDNQRPRIFILDIATGESSVWAGTGEQGWASINVDKLNTKFYYPTTLAVDKNLNVFVSEQHRIMKIDASGQVSRFAGHDTYGDVDDENPENARFKSIAGMSFGADGTLYVTDTYNHKIRKISPTGKVTTLIGNGSAGTPVIGGTANMSKLNHPLGAIALKDGDVLIADGWNNSVLRVDTDGIIHSFAGKQKYSIYQGMGSYAGDNGLAVDAELNTPTKLAADENGNVFITDQFNHKIRMVSKDGKITTIAGEAQGFAPHGKRLNFPNGIQVIDGHLYVADSGNRVVVKYKIAK
ncbi:SMP-30/gluconolactonase/LRE family protein [Pseudomonas sp. B21-036]|uniref:SMP-30/gluconolactonase/LRE family protein n=1 Tax=unclassified Pseudomonas TaxID=196821 RepID=UPI00215FD66C|nr:MULTISPECIES: SMP-30/gluconolactonase/LRE family protein [unclassified Pseudomonas]MDD1955461.1 SMP-30/gluconolactonase/LRE family protein [Pseudomonas sp. 8209]UVL49597.1 SMP-30/gluconolactonase/LRE family protein [Pseudomonas sp. B21-036]